MGSVWFLFGAVKMSWSQTAVMAAQHPEATELSSVKMVKVVRFMLCDV